MDWGEFLRIRAERLVLVRTAEHAALRGWAFAREPELLRSVIAVWEAADPHPGPGQLALSLAPPEALPSPPPSQSDVAEQLHRIRLAKAMEARTLIENSPENRRLWALETLSFLGDEVEDRERAAWAREPLPADPRGDQALAMQWTAVLHGGAPVWRDQARWEALCLPPAVDAFRQVLATRELPPGVARQALSDLRDGFWFQFLGAKGGIPGWAELATRVLETLGGTEALAPLLNAEDWATASACAAVRGTWPATLATALPELAGSGARAIRLGQRLAQDPAHAEALLDAHVVLRLLDTWASSEGTDPVRSWNVVVQNRGRTRARLRALVMARPAALGPALLSLDALQARTVAAVRRYAWDWAWESMAHGFAWDFARAVTPPCEAPPALEALSEADLPALRTWVLLVLLKGRYDHLRRWVETGGTGDRDGTWGRLLNDELPDLLRDPASEPSGGRAVSRYHRLRAWLHDGQDEVISAWRPLLRALVVLPPSRTLARSMEALLRPGWDEAVPFPKAGFPTFQAHAAAVLAATEPAL